MTGRFGFRTGIGLFLSPTSTKGLRPSEQTLPELLPYASALIGKWHLGTVGIGGPLAPNQAGWDDFSGTLHSQVSSYYNWVQVENGVFSENTTYNTTFLTDRAIAWMAHAPQPWICQVSYQAAHVPFHIPPPSLHSYIIPPGEEDLVMLYLAAIEAMDTEIGRLLQAVAPSTTVIFAGDNGPPASVYSGPSRGAKFTPYEAGINVPLIVAGDSVASQGREEPALVHLVDLFATCLELAGVPNTTGQDSVSLVPYMQGAATPLRTTVFTESFPEGTSSRTSTLTFDVIMDGQFKLATRPGLGEEEMYDLAADPGERDNLLLGILSPSQLATYEALKDQLLALKYP